MKKFVVFFGILGIVCDFIFVRLLSFLGIFGAIDGLLGRPHSSYQEGTRRIHPDWTSR